MVGQATVSGTFCSPSAAMTRSAERARARRSRATGSSCLPALVGTIPDFERVKSSVPQACSSRRICRDRAGCETKARRAAEVTEPVSRTAMKLSRCPLSMQRTYHRHQKRILVLMAAPGLRSRPSPRHSLEPAMPATPQSAAVRQRRSTIGAFVGTAIEWYDFFLFGTAAALVFGTVFYPDLAPGAGLLASFATFWVGFLARPLGGLVFSHFGDRLGRRNTLIATLVLMGAATTGIGLLPTYEQVGIAAPVLLIVFRAVQGLAVGGEWGGAVVLATEN